jgi:hypothetical protein
MPPARSFHTRHIIRTTTAAVVMAGCRPAAAPVPAPPETVRLAGATARFTLVEHRHVEQEYRGRPIVTDAVTRVTLTVALDTAPAGFRIVVVLDSATVSGDAGVPPEAVASATGARFEADVAENGAVQAVTGPDDGNPLLEQLALRVRELVPRLPAGGAAPGAVWRDTARIDGTTAGIPISIDVRGRHEGAGAWADLDGRSVLPLATDSEYALAGEGNRAGQWVTMTGAGTSHLRRLVTHGGVVAVGIRNDTLRATLELPASGLTIPLIQVRTDTLRRVDR